MTHPAIDPITSPHTIEIKDMTPPTVVSTFPANGVSELKVTIIITVTFSEPMDGYTLTSTNFILKNSKGEPVECDISYEPAIFKVNLKPVNNLNYGETYIVTITTNVKDSAGNNLQETEVWTFTTIKSEPAAKDGSWWDTWEPIVTALTVLGTILAALIGFLIVRKKRGMLKKYLAEIESTFGSYSKGSDYCEKELLRLKTEIKTKFNEGKIEENHYIILDRKISEYIGEVKKLAAKESDAARNAMPITTRPPVTAPYQTTRPMGVTRPPPQPPISPQHTLPRPKLARKIPVKRTTPPTHRAPQITHPISSTPDSRPPTSPASCPQCGTPVDEGAFLCKSCGEILV